MKFKVVDGYRTVKVVEADTIENLKAQIMECFSLTVDDLKKRLLVRDSRVRTFTIFRCPKPMLNGFDLLELEEASILKDHFCSDCLDDDDPLLLGWKGPFIISLVSSPANSLISAFNEDSVDIKVYHNDTLRNLKKDIASATKQAVTEDNLPTIFSQVHDNKPLIFFGFYNYYKPLRDDYDKIDDDDDEDEMVKFYINRNRDNKLVLKRICSFPWVSLCRTVRTETTTPLYFGEKYRNDRESKFMADMWDQYGEKILARNETPKKKMNKGMEGDKEDAGPSYQLYQPSKKEMDAIKDTTNQLKKKRIGRKKRIGMFI